MNDFYVTFDFDTVTKKPKIVSNFLPEIRELLSTEDKASIFARRRFGKNIPSRKYAITNKGSFDLPFYETIRDVIQNKFPALSINTTQNFAEKWLLEPIWKEPLPLKLAPRQYQYDSATKALNAGRGIIVLPTSAGKTLTVALIANTIASIKKQRILILVPNIQLAEQTHQDLLDYGMLQSSMSKWTGNYEYQSTQIVIANYQILLSDKQDISVLNEFGTVIIDECHKLATADKITKLVKSLKAKHIFGFTGSLPENEFEVWSLNRIFGPVIYLKHSVELRQDKFISKVRVVAIKLEHKNIPTFSQATMSDPTIEYEEEINWLHTNNFRNDVILKIINNLNTNTLILVDRIAHGEELLSFLTAHTKKQCFFVTGSVDLEEREKIRSLMEKENDTVCIAISKIFSTGISIKNLHNVLFAAIGKARIKIIQSIGRSLRLHHNKEIATIFDIADNNLRYGNKHFTERLNLYNSENIPVIFKEVVEK